MTPETYETGCGQRTTTIPPQLIEHTKNTDTYEVGYPGPGLGQAHIWVSWYGV
jgi:hypothetical protein